MNLEKEKQQQIIWYLKNREIIENVCKKCHTLIHSKYNERGLASVMLVTN